MRVFGFFATQSVRKEETILMKFHGQIQKSVSTAEKTRNDGKSGMMRSLPIIKSISVPKNRNILVFKQSIRMPCPIEFQKFE